jgi:hypothetical protein
MKYLLFIVLLLSAGLVYAQLPETALENIVESAPENADPEEVVQLLSYYRQHPLNLNAAGAEELGSPGLFDQVQVLPILNHRTRYGALIAFEELQAISGISLPTLQRIKPFCKVEPVINKQEWQPGNVFTNGKHILLLRSRRAFGVTTDPAFRGDSYSQNISWRYTSGTLLDIGFNGDKDPGESYFAKGKLPLMDSWNYHFFARPGGKFKALALGDFQINCGQGLVVWTGFAGTKGPEALNIRKLGPVLRPYTAFGEYGNYRGAAFSFGGNRILFTGWFSNKLHDSDLEGNYFRTVRNDGYHRTENEITGARSVKRMISGFNFRYKSESLQHEITLQRIRYNATVRKGEKSYQFYEPEGSTFLNASYAYSWLYRNLSSAGEVAVNEKGSITTLNSLLLAVDSKLAFVMLHRILPANYFSVTADPFRENSQPVNEHGFYSGMQWQMRPKVKLSAYMDYFVFPWLKYQVDRTSRGNEWFLQTTWVPQRHSELYLRFRRQVKEENTPGEYAGLHRLQQVRRDNLRADARLKLSQDINYQVRCEWTRVVMGGIEKSDGWLLFQEIDLKPMGRSWSLSFRYSVFNTEDYDTRIYAFEQGLPGSFSLPAFYGSGTSAYLLMRFRLLKGLDVWARIGTERSYSKDSVRIWEPGIQIRWIFG